MAVDYIQGSIEQTRRMELAGVEPEQATLNLGPPAFLWRKFRNLNETWEVLPRLIAEWTLATIPEREPGVARAKLCLSIPKDVDKETGERMRTAFGLWLAGRGKGE